jgi:hypothetical protein
MIERRMRRPISEHENTHRVMKMTSITTRHSLVLCTALSFGCSDDRMRELGYTSDPSRRSDDLTSTTEPPPCDTVFVTSDQAQRLAADDLALVPAADRPFQRYLSLASALDGGACGDQIERAAAAASKIVNSLSQASDIARPTPVGDGPVLVRLDLRDYGWVRQVTLRGQTFPDVWEAMIGVNPFALAMTGDAGDFLAGETTTRAPVLDADSFIGLVAEPDVYYSLLGMPATLAEVRESVGLPGELEPREAGALRTAVLFSRILRPAGNVRVLDRYAIPTRAGGSYWEAAAMDAGAFLADPLNLQLDVQRLIAFTLPNELLAFAITNPLGEVIGQAELVLDTNRDDFIATANVSCANCHAMGFIPAPDDVRSAILASPDLFEPALVDAFEASPSDEERAELAQVDSDVYIAALERAGVSPIGGDPISQRYFEFIADVDLEEAAADLLVTADELEARIGELDRGLLPLALGLTLSRQRFGELFGVAFCGLHAGDENPPASCL